MTSPPFGTHERESVFKEFGSAPAVSAPDNEKKQEFPGKVIACTYKYNEKLAN